MAAVNKQKKNKPQQQQQQQQTQNNKKDKVGKKKSGSSGNETKSSSSVFPWLFGIFLVTGAIAAVITFDVSTNGGGIFESKIKFFLNILYLLL